MGWVRGGGTAGTAAVDEVAELAAVAEPARVVRVAELAGAAEADGGAGNADKSTEEGAAGAAGAPGIAGDAVRGEAAGIAAAVVVRMAVEVTVRLVAGEGAAAVRGSAGTAALQLADVGARGMADAARGSPAVAVADRVSGAVGGGFDRCSSEEGGGVGGSGDPWPYHCAFELLRGEERWKGVDGETVLGTRSVRGCLVEVDIYSRSELVLPSLAAAARGQLRVFDGLELIALDDPCRRANGL